MIERDNTSRSGTPKDTSFDFDWSLIRSFLAVMDTGSLLAASRLRNSTQPTIGRHIEMLERQLGKVLFERTGRGLTPTDDARLVAAHALRMQADADALGRAVAGSTDALGGLVRISASRMVATHLLPGLIVELRRQLPDTDIAVVSSDASSNLLRRQADIALRHVRPLQSSLVARKIGDSPVRPCASVRYLKYNGTPRTPEELMRHPLIGSDHGRVFHNALARLTSAHGVDVEGVRVVVRSDDAAARFASVRAGLGIGFSSRYAITQFDDVVDIPVELALPTLPFWLVVHREIRTTPRIRDVYDALAILLRGAM